jgi:hypothetical protein
MDFDLGDGIELGADIIGVGFGTGRKGDGCGCILLILFIIGAGFALWYLSSLHNQDQKPPTAEQSK